MTTLFWHRLAAGWYVAGHYCVKRETSRRWRMYERGAPIGFRPTLALAQMVAERAEQRRNGRAA